ncbi:ABC transporter substrate-binding protein [Metallosphaera tengchongensis]|uniref:ABC transporter substrate-binding protein n=1 Tax=Metallosphaera tengchongensis TaxID=1532350 RepID=UPI001FE7A812|nr:ABC transporter substrate-binding protein [Metallosphaera tengchongensis]
MDDFVVLEYPPKRIVSLDPASTETIFTLGAGERVVGTDAFSYRPAEAKKLPKLGSYTHVNLELLEKLEPDVIFTTLGAQKELTRKLLNSKFPVYPMRVSTTVGEILNNVLLVGNVIGLQNEARELQVKLLSSLAGLRKFERRPLLYVELDLGGPITPGFPSHISDGIWISGGRNAFDKDPEAYFEPPVEVLKELKPDLIIYEPKRYMPWELTRFRDSLERRGLRHLLSSPIYVSRGDFLAHQGPSFVTEAIPWLNSLVFSWIQSGTGHTTG